MEEAQGICPVQFHGGEVVILKYQAECQVGVWNLVPSLQDKGLSAGVEEFELFALHLHTGFEEGRKRYNFIISGKEANGGVFRGSVAGIFNRCEGGGSP